MIIDILIQIYSWIIGVLVFVLPAWSIYPQVFLDGLTFFTGSMAKLNVIFPISEIFQAIIFLIQFEVIYYTAKLVIIVLKLIRGNDVEI